MNILNLIGQNPPTKKTLKKKDDSCKEIKGTTDSEVLEELDKVLVKKKKNRHTRPNFIF